MANAVSLATAQISDNMRPSSDAADWTAPAVVVKVGQPVKVFHVNEQLLCASSDYVKTALKPQWLEGGRRVITLPEETEKAFNLYVNWLYTGKLFVKNVEEGKTPDNGTTPLHDLVNAYVLGDKLLDSDYKDAVVDAMESEMRCDYRDRGATAAIYIPGIFNINRIYARTVKGSHLRKLLVDKYAEGNNAELVTENANQTFLFELSQALVLKGSETTKEASARCAYHEHKDGRCCRSKRS